MFAKMKLRQRILLGYLAPLLLLLGAMSVVFVNMQEAERQAVLVEDTHARMEVVRDLHFALSKMQRATRGYLLEKNATTYQDFQTGAKDFNTHSEMLKNLIIDPQQQDTLRRIVEKQQELFPLQQRMMALVDEGKEAAAIAVFRSGKPAELVHMEDELVNGFEQRETAIIKERQEAENVAMHTVINSIIYGMVGFITLAISIAFGVAAAISRDITANAAQLSAAASEIAATIDQHERTASQQAAAATETSATITELSASSRQSAEQAANAATLAGNASTTTAQGGDATQQAVLAMANLKNKIATMADQILRLGEQTGQIGGIAELVKDLSGEINMLALNAAVEAARAGEHGKGFAVVASEVRKLAVQSKKSAEQATALVADIQKTTNSSIMMTEEGAHTVDEVTQLAQKVAELFNNLSGMAGSVNENAQQVMLNAKQQSAAFTQVAEATNSIAAGAKETAAGISQTKIGVRKLNEAAENLKAIA